MKITFNLTRINSPHIVFKNEKFIITILEFGNITVFMF